MNLYEYQTWKNKGTRWTETLRLTLVLVLIIIQCLHKTQFIKTLESKIIHSDHHTEFKHTFSFHFSLSKHIETIH